MEKTLGSKIIKSIFKYTGILLAIILVAFFLVFFAIQQPKIQTWLVGQATQILSNKTGTDISVGRVGIKFFRTISIEDVYVADIHGDTLAYIGALDTRMAYFNPLKGKLHFNSLSLEGVRANIYRTEQDSTFNYQFLIDAFAKDSDDKKDKKPAKKEAQEEKPKQAIDFKIKQVHLADIDVLFDDKKGGGGYEVKLNTLDIDVRDLDITQQKIHLKSLKIDEPYFVLSNYPHEKEEKEKNPFDVNIGWDIDVQKLDIKGGHFGMHHHGKARTYSENGFEFNWFDVRKINLTARNFSWKDSLQVDLKNLSAQSSENNLDLKKLSTQFTMTNQGMVGNRLFLSYNESVIDGDAVLKFNSFQDFGSFLTRVHIDANFRQLKANGKDIAVWAKSAQPYVPDVEIKGKASGTVSNIHVDQLSIETNKNTFIKLQGRLIGLPDVERMLIDAKISELKTSSQDIKSIIPYVNLPAELDSIGNIQLQGDFKGTIHDFKTNINAHTDAGNLLADVHLKMPKFGIPSYSGRIQSPEAKIHKFIKDDKFENLGLDLVIDGKGFNLNQLDTRVQGTVQNFQYNYYTYGDIYLDGYINDRMFEGKANLIDECAIVDFEGMVDFRDPELPKYKFYTNINSADLQLLNLIPNRLIVSVEGDFEFEGKDINNLIGRADLSNIHLIDDNINVSLSDLNISLDKIDEYKQYTFQSEDINGYMKGYFDPLKLPASLQFFFAQHTTLLDAPGIESIDKLLATQDLEMNIVISKDIGIASLIDPKIKSFSEISIAGIYNNELGKVNLDIDIDSLNYNDIQFNQFKANVFERNDSLIFVSNLHSLNKDKLKINNVKFESTSNLNGFYSRLRVQDPTDINNLELITIVNFVDDSIKIRLPNSHLKINDKKWIIDPNNSILLVDSIIQLRNFTLEQGDQRILLRNRQNLSDAFVKIENLNIADLAQIIDSTGVLKSGILHANIRLKNVLTNPEIDGNVKLEKLDIFDETVDIIQLDAKLSDIDKLLDIEGTIQDEDYDVSLKGQYALDPNNSSPIELAAKFDKLSLKFLGFPFILGNEISNLNASTRGEIHVTGALDDIRLDGMASIIDTASLKVNFLGNTLKLFNTDIVLKPRSIEFFQGNPKSSTVTIADNANNRAQLRAKLEHRSFKDFAVDAFITSNKFNFLNTTYRDNQDFFGKVFASGEVEIKGPLDDISMNINATTLPQTEFNIVVEGSSDDQLYDFVKFVDRSAPVDTIEIKDERIKTSSLNLEINVNATTDAQLRMYLDYAKNDVIRARGTGELQLLLNPNGMQMYGEYMASSGDYLFSQQDIINKRFSIREGSTINWSGDVMEAKMDVDAYYSSRVNMNDIVDSTSSLRNRRFPVDVILNIGGTLAETDINFSLEPSQGQSNTPDELQAVLDRVNNDPAQVNTQAFSLILFNRFLNLQSTEGAGSQAGNLGIDMAVTTLSEFFNAKISEYVNDALSMLIPGAEVAINQGTDNTGIRVTQKLNNDRLIINLGGDVQYGNREEIRLQENNTGFIGDVEVEYLITEDGRIRAKAYSRYDNTIIRLENDSYLRSGLGITYQKEVDKFFDLLKIDKERRRKRKEEKKLKKEKASRTSEEETSSQK